MSNPEVVYDKSDINAFYLWLSFIIVTVLIFLTIFFSYFMYKGSVASEMKRKESMPISYYTKDKAYLEEQEYLNEARYLDSKKNRVKISLALAIEKTVSDYADSKK